MKACVVSDSRVGVGGLEFLALLRCYEMVFRFCFWSCARPSMGPGPKGVIPYTGVISPGVLLCALCDWGESLLRFILKCHT